MLLKYKERRQRYTSINLLTGRVLNQLLMTYHHANRTGISQSSLEKLLIVIDDDQHRDPQVTKIQRIRDYRLSTCKRNIYSTFHPPMIQGNQEAIDKFLATGEE